jgi:hypothetical protein
MKFLRIAALLLFVSINAWAAPGPAGAPAAGATVTGQVLEVTEVDAYTYLRLKTADGETWAAVGKAPVKVGQTVTIEGASVMTNFESKTLKKTFPKIVFGSLAGTGAGMPGMGAGMTGSSSMAGMAGHGADSKAAVGDVKVAKATGANAKTIAEIVAQASSLKDKPVVVRGKVVKYNAGIMQKNWIHLRDGTGTDKDKNNDILVTTVAQAKVGDVVTVKGTVRTDRDIGAGYVYKVMVEDATLQAK